MSIFDALRLADARRRIAADVTEMATAYASFGTAVTIFARSGLLQGQEDFAVELVTAGLAGLGIDIRRASPTLVERTVFGEGDGRSLGVHDSAVGRLGALACWEHL